MAVRHRMGNSFHFAGNAGPTAYNWLNAWLMAHNTEVRNHQENNLELVAVDPAITPESCTYRLDFVYHFEHDTEEHFTAAYQEIVDALMNGQIVALCDAEFGSDVE